MEVINMFLKQTELFPKTECNLNKPCRYCGHNHGYIYKSNSIHSGYINCCSCGKFHKWVSKDDFELATKHGLVNETKVNTIEY